MILTQGAVREEDVTFSATGHNHSGGADGENVPEAAVVFSAAGHTHVGGAQGNTLGLDAIKVDEQSAENAGAVTVTTGPSGGADIATLAEMNVVVGDRILLSTRVPVTKGATGGTTLVQIIKHAGTATIQTYNDEASIEESRTIPANELRDICLDGVAKVTVAGTLTLKVRGGSEGSDSTVAIGAGQLYALVLRGIG